MKYKSVRVPGIKGEILVREDGNEILHNEKSVHFNLVKSKTRRSGYYQVSIEGKRMYVQRLVALAFVLNKQPVSFKYILHKDLNSLNNHYENLEWCTRKMITERSFRDNPTKPDSYRGTSKIPYEDALKIVERLKNGEYAKDICKEYGVSEMSITRIRKRYGGEPGTRQFPKQVKETVLRLLEKHTPSELVESTGISYHTLYRWNKQIKNKK